MLPPVPHIPGKERPPRVLITYDAWTNGTREKRELPFVVGVLADLSGQPSPPLKPLQERQFTLIDRASFDEVMKGQGPRLALKVPNVLTNDNTSLAVELRFNRMADFEPGRVAHQVAPLRELLEMRQSLVELSGLQLADNDQGERLLKEALSRTKAMLLQSREPAGSGSADPGKVQARINHWIREIDRALSAQLNEILHSAPFQKLEGTWRGLYYMVDQTSTSETLKIRVLNVTWSELFDDLMRTPEGSRNALGKMVLEDVYGRLEGEPFGLLVGDYSFDCSSEDVTLLTRIAQVAAEAHAPFVAAAAPEMFQLSCYTDLSKPYQLKPIFQKPEYALWRSFRETEEARYTALTLPRVLAREPYGKGFQEVEGFHYEEGVDSRTHQNYLWMNAAWTYAARVTSSFFWDGWFIRTRGVEGGGKVEGLPVHTFPTDEGGLAMKCPTEIGLIDRREMELSDLGFLPLMHCKNTDFAAFLGSQSCQKPKIYFSNDANANAELSTKLNFLLCVSRFAHFLKVMARNKVGQFMDLKDRARWLNEWISNYVIAGPDDASEELLAQYPLREARVDVEDIPGRPDWYRAKAFLRPHYLLEGLYTAFILVFNVPQPLGLKSN